MMDVLGLKDLLAPSLPRARRHGAVLQILHCCAPSPAREPGLRPDQRRYLRRQGAADRCRPWCRRRLRSLGALARAAYRQIPARQAGRDRAEHAGRRRHHRGQSSLCGRAKGRHRHRHHRPRHAARAAARRKGRAFRRHEILLDRLAGVRDQCLRRLSHRGGEDLCRLAATRSWSSAPPARGPAPMSIRAR